MERQIKRWVQGEGYNENKNTATIIITTIIITIIITTIIKIMIITTNKKNQNRKKKTGKFRRVSDIILAIMKVKFTSFKSAILTLPPAFVIYCLTPSSLKS